MEVDTTHRWRLNLNWEKRKWSDIFIYSLFILSVIISLNWIFYYRARFFFSSYSLFVLLIVRLSLSVPHIFRLYFVYFDSFHSNHYCQFHHCFVKCALIGVQFLLVAPQHFWFFFSFKMITKNYVLLWPNPIIVSSLSLTIIIKNLNFIR